MDAWILDESPGSYRWGSIEPPDVTASDVRIKVVTSALNHMDLWVTKGLPKPPLPHVPGCDVAGIVDAIGADVTHVQPGDEVVINPGVSPLGDIVALGIDSPMGDGFMIYGEHCWGGHATFAVAPGRNVVARSHVGHVRSDGVDDAGDVAPGNVRQGRPRQASCDPQVHVVEGARDDLDPDVRCGHLERFDAAPSIVARRFVEDPCVHPGNVTQGGINRRRRRART